MTLDACLTAWRKKTITLAELSAALDHPLPQQLYDAVRDAERRGLLSAMPSAQLNGSRLYPLRLKYRTCRPEEDTAALYALHPALLRSGRLQKRPADFLKYSGRLQQLSRYLFAHPEQQLPISRKERSFAIFGEEKVLDDRTFCHLLQQLGLSNDALAFYDTPQYCFADYVPQRKPQLQLLVCENKDIWFGLRRIMFEQRRFTLFGAVLDGVVYGEGNAVTEGGKLPVYTDFLQAEEVRYLYWGDLDREGLNIFLRLQAACPTLSLQLFDAAYLAMLEQAASVTLPPSDDERGLLPDTAALFAAFPAERRAQAETLLRQNRRLPQEIISFAYLNDHMR